jgi:hypothetical protein
MTTIELTDGRLLDVEDAGGDGHVLLFHHGTPGSVTPSRRWRRPRDGAGSGW